MGRDDELRARSADSARGTSARAAKDELGESPTTVDWPSTDEAPTGEVSPPTGKAGERPSVGSSAGSSDPTQPDPDDTVSQRFRGSKKPVQYRRLGPYEIHELLGQGGIGMVFRAFDHRLERWVALKLLRMDSDAAARRLLDEAKAQARVDHENVCRVYEAGELDGEAYIAMQFIDGEPLSRVLHRMSRREKVEAMLRVTEGIQAAHLQGLIHRDVKPGNILIERTPRGEWKPYVLDFGLAKELEGRGETSVGQVKGTPSYMPPEQVSGDLGLLDERADVYSLGATLYESLLGRSLFADTTGVAVLLKVLNEDPEPMRRIDATIPVDLESVVMRCLEKQPARRYGSARELADELQRYLDGEPVRARGLNVFDRFWRRLKRRRLQVAVAVLALAAAASLAALVVSQVRARQRAQLLDVYREKALFIENFIGNVYEEPTHDVTADKERVRRQLAEIRDSAARDGRLARGPSHYALGMGHLALHEYEAARRNLQIAWQEGTRQPDVALALGRALGALYERELRLSQWITDDAQRAERQQEIGRTFRDPALEFLRAGRDVESDAAELVAAQLAFWDQEYDDALAMAQAASERAPWLYEAWTLAGDIHLSRGRELDLKGRYGEAKVAYEAARDAYGAAAERGRSDVRIFEGQCRLGADLVRLESYGLGGPTEPYFELGRAACERARRVDPERPDPDQIEATLYYRYGEDRMLDGLDPLAELDHARRAAGRALEKDPDHLDSHASKGWSLALSAQWQIEHGGDPRPQKDAALACFRRSVELHPRYAMGWNGIGYSLHHFIRWQMENGEDPAASFEVAIEALERALRINPKYLYALDSLATTHVFEALWRYRTGGDPAPSVERALQLGERLRELNPQYAWGYITPAQALEIEALETLRQGGDPRAAIERGRALLAIAVEAVEEGESHLALGRLALVEGRYLAARDAGSSTDTAVDRSAGDAFQAARREIERGLELTRGDTRFPQALAELALHEATWRLAEGRPARRTIQDGLARVAETLEMHPELVEVRAIEGRLLILAGEAERGRRLLADALARNPGLAASLGEGAR